VLDIAVWSVTNYNASRHRQMCEQLADCHNHTHLFNGPFSGTTHVSRYQKGKTNLDFTEARDSEWQWHPLCKFAPSSIQITTPVPHHSVSTGRMPFLPPNQQRQSTEGSMTVITNELYILWTEFRRRKLSPTLATAHYSCRDNAIGLVEQSAL